MLWVGLALLVLLAWGIQGFAISHANKSMKAESIFFYMTLTGILLIPVALAMTDFTNTGNQLGLEGPGFGGRDSNPQLDRGPAAGLFVPLRQGHHRFSLNQRRRAGRYGPISLSMAWCANKLVWNAAKTVNSVGIVWPLWRRS